MTVSKRRIVVMALLSVGGLLGLVVAVASWSTWQAVQALRQGELERIPGLVNSARPVATGLSKVTGGRSQTMQCWTTGLATLGQLPQIQEVLLKLGQEYGETGLLPLQPLGESIKQFSQLVPQLSRCTTENRLVQVVLGSSRDEVSRQLQTAELVLAAATPLFQADQRWLIMFQNTTELRPTGGFTGSYAIVEIKDGYLQLTAIEDIYDADGQVEWFREAPAGLRQYTSGNRGLRLPDANWWPDFPTSTQTQLAFMEQAGKGQFQGVVSVNLSLLQKILELTGPLALPDYELTLTPDNAPIVLRSHAEDFFPGSRKKKQLLRYTFEQLQRRFAELSAQEKKQLFTLMVNALSSRDLQIFSTASHQQQQLQQLGWTGQLDTSQGPLLALVEANVGINKANQFITRSVGVETISDRLQVTLHLKNEADRLAPSLPASQSGYVNYQRILTSPGLSVVNLNAHTTRPPAVTSTSWQTVQGETMSEQGFLLTILPGQTQTITFGLERADHSQPIRLWHQPGTGAIPFTYTDAQGKTFTEVLNEDRLIY